MPDLLDRIRSELDDRMTQLRPAVDEFARLQHAADAIDAMASSAAPSASRAAGTRRHRPPRSAAPATARARRTRPPHAARGRAKPGETQLRVIEQLRSGPGSTSTAVAGALGISANAAAATISRLVKQGRARRLDTGGYSATDA